LYHSILGLRVIKKKKKYWPEIHHTKPRDSRRLAKGDFFFLFFTTLKPRMSDTKVYEP